MRHATLSQVKERLFDYLHEAAEEEVVITHLGKPIGVLIGLEDEDDWFDYEFERDPRFLARIAQARRSLEKGEGIRLADLEFDEDSLMTPN